MLIARKLIIVILVTFLVSPTYTEAHKGSHSNKQNESTLISTPADIDIKKYSAKIKQSPDDYYYYLKLGEAYIQKGREIGNIIPYNLAQNAIEKSLELYPDSYAGYIYMAQISSYKHDFEKAIDHAKKALELRPDKAIAYGVLGDAYLELGLYKEALKAYGSMHYLEPGFSSYSRIAQLRFLWGDTANAIEAMDKAIEFGSKNNLVKENLAWAKVILGSLYFKQGKLDLAEDSYKEALEIYKNYYLALEHLAELNSATGNYKEAINLYEKAIELNPKSHFYIELGNIHKQLRQTNISNQYYHKAEQSYQDVVSSGIKGHSRELVLYYLENNKKLDMALNLAEQDSRENDDIYADDTLAWAYYKLGDLDKAEFYIKKSIRLGTKDAVLYYHAGMIYFELNKLEEAKSYFQTAIQINPNFDHEKVQESRTYVIEINRLLVSKK